jgi:hypothetical protein
MPGFFVLVDARRMRRRPLIPALAGAAAAATAFDDRLTLD